MLAWRLHSSSDPIEEPITVNAGLCNQAAQLDNKTLPGKHSSSIAAVIS
jgi:hypothetical protein